MEGANFLIEALKSIAMLFKESNVKYCLAGGLAVGMLSTPRATEDIDIIIKMKSNSSRLRDRADVEALTDDMETGY